MMFCPKCQLMTSEWDPTGFHELCSPCTRELFRERYKRDPVDMGCPECTHHIHWGELRICRNCLRDEVAALFPRCCPGCRRITNDFKEGEVICKECDRKSGRERWCSRGEHHSTDFSPKGVYCRTCTSEYNRIARSKRA